MNNSRWWVLCSLLLFTACGKFQEKFGRLNSGETTVTVAPRSGEGIQPYAQEMFGKIMLYFVGVNGHQHTESMNLHDRYDTKDFNLPNGSYRVFAIGWDGDNSGPCAAPSPCSTFQGQARCTPSAGVPVQLSGGSLTIPLNFAAANCDFTIPSVYSPGQAGDTNFRGLDVKTCSSGTGSGCSVGGTQDVAMEVLVYKKTPAGLVIDESQTEKIGCAQTTGGILLTAKNFPPGNANSAYRPFIYRLQVHTGAGGTCSSAVSKTFLFGNGLHDYPSSSGPNATEFLFISAAKSAVYL